MNRRDLLRTLAAGSWAWAAAQGLRPAPPRSPALPRRRLGRTGLMISEIALGGSPLPEESLLLQLVERGVNYLDTSDSYENGNCERKAGRLFKAVGRDKIIVHARFHLAGSWSEASIVASVERSLRRLATDYVDILGIHGVENPAHLTDERVLGAFGKLKGKFRFRGLTCHAHQHEVIPEAVACGYYDMVQIGYNVFDIEPGAAGVRTYSDYLGESGLRRLIELCRAKDVGVTAMKTLKIGGRRQDLKAYQAGGVSLYQAMIKWVLENRGVAAAVIEIMNEREMAEDLAAAEAALTSAERNALEAHVAAHAGRTCHLCGSCQAACPEGIRLADLSRGIVYRDAYAKRDRARSVVARAAAAAPLASCRDCGACEDACPYGLPVRERARRAAVRFA